MDTTTETTSAEKRARSIAAVFEGNADWTVEVKGEETAPILYSDGTVLSDGWVTWTVWATGKYGETFYASWRTRTTGRKTTCFGYGNRSYGYGSKGKRLTAGNVGLYAQMAARTI